MVLIQDKPIRRSIMNPKFRLYLNRFKAFVMLAWFICSFSFFSSATSVSAGSINQPISQACIWAQPGTVLPDGPIAPMVLPAGTPSEDANWLVKSQEMLTQKDASGKDYAVIVTVRRNPHPIISKSNNSAVLPAATQYCTFLYQESREVTDTRSGLTQYLKNYYNLYNITPSPGITYKAYHTYRTELRWTRTNNTYTLGQPSVAWFFRGVDCYNVGGTNTQSSGGFTPAWSGNGTSTYLWTFMDLWPTRTPVSGNMHTLVTTTGFQNGVQLTPNLSTVIYYSE
jgi:hypothetical protein